jgi:hypothetical protein
MQLAAQGAQGPAWLFRPLPAQFESSPAPLRLLLLPRPRQRLSVQLLKRRGPLLADPLLLDLPQPPTAIRLGHGQPVAPAQPAPAVDPIAPRSDRMSTAHSLLPLDPVSTLTPTRSSH